MHTDREYNYETPNTSLYLLTILKMWLHKLMRQVGLYLRQWTVPQLSIMIIYNSTWSILIQKIRIILSGDNLT